MGSDPVAAVVVCFTCAVLLVPALAWSEWLHDVIRRRSMRRRFRLAMKSSPSHSERP